MDETKVILYDPNATYLDLCIWVKKYCQSYKRSNHTDVSDVSLTFDLIYEFWFEDPKDATMFYMKWS